MTKKIDIKLARQDNVALSHVIENPENPKQVTEENFRSLAKSLQEDRDFLESSDILVYEKDGNYHVIGGNHWVKALRLQGFTHIPVTIYDVFTDGEVDEIEGGLGLYYSDA